MGRFRAGITIVLTGAGAVAAFIGLDFLAHGTGRAALLVVAVLLGLGTMVLLFMPEDRPLPTPEGRSPAMVKLTRSKLQWLKNKTLGPQTPFLDATDSEVIVTESIFDGRQPDPPARATRRDGSPALASEGDTLVSALGALKERVTANLSNLATPRRTGDPARDDQELKEYIDRRTEFMAARDARLVEAYEAELSEPLRRFYIRAFENGFFHPGVQNILSLDPPNGGALIALGGYLPELMQAIRENRRTTS